jgi:hypothetical protein
MVHGLRSKYGRLYLHRHTVLEIVLHTHRTGMDDIPSDHEVQMRVRGMKVKELRQELERDRLDSRGKKELLVKRLLAFLLVPHVQGATERQTTELNRLGAVLGKIMRHPDARDFHAPVRLMWPTIWRDCANHIDSSSSHAFPSHLV